MDFQISFFQKESSGFQRVPTQMISYRAILNCMPFVKLILKWACIFLTVCVLSFCDALMRQSSKTRVTDCYNQRSTLWILMVLWRAKWEGCILTMISSHNKAQEFAVQLSYRDELQIKLQTNPGWIKTSWFNLKASRLNFNTAGRMELLKV